MNRLIKWAVLAAALACGGESYEDGALITETDDDPSFATTEQDVTFIPQYGFRRDLASSNTRCLNPGVNSQACMLPPDKTYTVRVTGTGMSATQKIEAVGLVGGFIAAFKDELTSWTMSQLTGSSGGDVQISYGTLPGTAKTSIHTYAHATATGASTLEDFGATGTYEKYGTISCTVDRAKIVQDFSTAQQPRVLRHALYYCANMGLGLGSGGATSRATAIVVTPDVNKSENLGDYSKCMANTYSPTTDPNQIFAVCGPGTFITCPCADKTDS